MVGEGASLLQWGMEGRVPGNIALWLRLFESQPSSVQERELLAFA